MTQTNQEKVTSYIKETVIDGYMLTDLERIIGLPIVPSHAGNCNFPIVIYIFSCIEFLGTLISEQPIPDRSGATRDRIWAYMGLTFGVHFQEFQQHGNAFIQIFRHGLVHEFFAKNAGVSRHGANLFGISHGGKLVLDADRFYEIFNESCKTLKTLIDTSEEIAIRISDRYLDLQQHNRDQWPLDSATFTRVSGATQPRQYVPDPSITTPSYPPEDSDS